MVVHHLPELKETGVPHLIPGLPITCKVDNTEKYTTRSKVQSLDAKSITFSLGAGLNDTVHRKSNYTCLSFAIFPS